MQHGLCCAAAFGGCGCGNEVRLSSNQSSPLSGSTHARNQTLLSSMYCLLISHLRQSGTSYFVVNHSRAVSIPRAHPLSLSALDSETLGAVNSKDPRELDGL